MRAGTHTHLLVLMRLLPPIPGLDMLSFNSCTVAEFQISPPCACGTRNPSDCAIRASNTNNSMLHHSPWPPFTSWDQRPRTPTSPTAELPIMGLPDASNVFEKDSCPVLSMGDSHGSQVWKGAHVALEWSGGVRPGTLRNTPDEYMGLFARHKHDGAFIDGETVLFMVDRAMVTIAGVLMQYKVWWPAAADMLPEYHLKCDDNNAPRVLEMIFEQRYEPKAVCQEQRRSKLVDDYRSGRGGGAGGLLTDCVVREVMVRLTAMGIQVTWAVGGEFDGTGAVRAAQGCYVIIPSRDGDSLAYALGGITCRGQVRWSSQSITTCVTCARYPSCSCS